MALMPSTCCGTSRAAPIPSSPTSRPPSSTATACCQRSQTSPPQSEPLANQLRDRAAVGSSLRLLHHRADDSADRLLVALAHLLRGLGFGLDRAIDDALQLGGVGDLRQAFALDDLGRLPAVGDQLREDLLA